MQSEGSGGFHSCVYGFALRLGHPRKTYMSSRAQRFYFEDLVKLFFRVCRQPAIEQFIPVLQVVTGSRIAARLLGWFARVLNLQRQHPERALVVVPFDARKRQLGD